MKKISLYNILIISFICSFFLGCSSTQIIDVSKQDQVDILLSKIGDTELKISTNEDIKKLIIKSIVSLDSDIKISFVKKVDAETLIISKDFLNQEFIYFCKSANAYLEEITKQHLYSSYENDEILIFYKQEFETQASLIKSDFPGTKIFKLTDNYDDLVKEVFGLSGSYERSNLINMLVQENEVNFVPRPRNDFEKIYILADYDQSRNFVPSLRFNYILNKEIFASSRSVIRIEDRKKLLDFSDLILSVPNSFIEQSNSINLDKLSKISFLKDLIIISALEKNGFKSQMIVGEFGNIRYSQSTCSDMSMNLVKIDNKGRFIKL